MNLRNKKTGKLYEWCSIMVKKNRKSVKLIVAEKEDCKFIVEDDGETYYYESFEQMCEEWETVEDPRPKEPLIEDEKIRKAVRAWADVNGDTKLYYNRPTIEICVNDKAGYVIRSIKFKAEFREAIDIESGYYNITELCGEAE